MPVYEIVLASGSPRRKQLMSDLGLPFTVRTADIDETPLPEERPELLAERLAVQKAVAVGRQMELSDRPVVIVAADTVVALGSTIYGKPQDFVDAQQMLERLRDRQHQVHSAICLLDVVSGRLESRINTTQVRMRNYTSQELADYIATGDSMDKAGAYAIQHPDFAPVHSIEGCLTGVMGMPLADLCELLATYHIHPFCSLIEVCESHTHFRCCQKVA